MSVYALAGHLESLLGRGGGREITQPQDNKATGGKTKVSRPVLDFQSGRSFRS